MTSFLRLAIFPLPSPIIRAVGFVVLFGARDGTQNLTQLQQFIHSNTAGPQNVQGEYPNITFHDVHTLPVSHQRGTPTLQSISPHLGNSDSLFNSAVNSLSKKPSPKFSSTQLLQAC